MDEKKWVVGIDIGGTNFRIGLVDKGGNVSHFEKKSSCVLTGGDEIEDLYREIHSYLTSHDVLEQVESVVIGFPSILSRDRTTLYSTPNLPGFDNIDIVHPLGEKLGLPVFIEQDVNLLLLYDIHALQLDPSGTILGFYIGTGFGNSLYIDGKFYLGKNGVAGELGHIPLYGLTKRCNCGNIGCSEIVCSGMGLRALAEKYFPETSLDQIFVKHGESDVLRQYVADLAIPIATEVTLLDPDYAILGGGVITMEGFPREYLCECIKERARKPYPSANLDIRFSSPSPYSGVIGGGMYARRK